ncbi:hypothetical protein N4G70_34425 [Streptomyces sp. ASQP_92]|uniref:hypothetical protein n=1 Tax=Streptomyces sp. ASQP_92 TaxID=2979116 RepID=UPI0021C0DCE5|nr:hypothetical protein [Streptomyces sp. ASQP_92]MCT9093916.1 hypothetical protein [Streptomyces sp. ASQP_92]
MPELAMPKAAKRKGRTHTSRISPLDALALSTLSPGHIDMRTVETTQTRRISLVCPDCGTWVAVTHHRGTYLLKLVPHHTGKADVDAAIRCRSSNRLVDVDVTDDAWRRQYRDWAREERLAVDLTRHRRATVQTLKVARPQERPADRRAQWERAVPVTRRADAARTVPAEAIPTSRGRAVDGPAGAPLAMIPQTPGDPRSVRALATGILRAMADAGQDQCASDALAEHLTRAAYTHLATIAGRPLTPADQPTHTALVTSVRAALPAPAPGETATAYTTRCRSTLAA